MNTQDLTLLRTLAGGRPEDFVNLWVKLTREEQTEAGMFMAGVIANLPAEILAWMLDSLDRDS